MMISTIVGRLELDHRTAKYVLDKATKLRVPPATQGQHRRFELIEAISLAICTALVMAALPVQHAELVTNICMERERGSRRDGKYPFDGYQWTLTIFHARWCQLHRSPTKTSYNFDPDYNFSAIDGARIENDFEAKMLVLKTELDLTKIARILNKPL